MGVDVLDWHADQPPQVTLVFETEPGQIWKVRKSFGSGSDGWSYLEFSKDGVTFGQDVKGREVDGRLRELLRWGIEGPGGRARTKGLPDSPSLSDSAPCVVQSLVNLYFRPAVPADSFV